jgi:hypothetical protein
MGNDNSKPADNQNVGIRNVEVRSIMDNIVKHAARSNLSNSDTIGISSTDRSTLDMSSIDDERRRLRGGNLGVQRKRYLNAPVSLLEGVHQHGRGCGCSGNSDSYSETSTFSGGSCQKPNEPSNGIYDYLKNQIPSPASSSLSSVTMTQQSGGEYSANSDLTGGDCQKPNPAPENPYSPTSSAGLNNSDKFLSSTSEDPVSLVGGKNNYVRANTLYSPTSSDIDIDTMMREMQNGGKDTDSEIDSDTSSTNDTSDSTSDSDESTSTSDSTDSTTDRALSGGSSDFESSEDDVRIGRKVLFSTSESGTWYGSDSSNVRFRDLINRQ